MKHPTILVAGATGRTGAAVAAQLLAADVPVRAIVRSLDARSERLARLGADIAVADLFDPGQLRDAMRGTARAYFCPPFHPHMLQAATAFAAASADAGQEAIVGLGQWLAGPSHPSLMTRQHWLAERVFSMLPGVAYTAVNPGFFADSYLLALGSAAHLGFFPMPLDGDSRNAPPSNEDIARVAVAALLDPARHAGRTYRPTGPVLLSVREMVAIIGRAVGRPVRHVPMPMWLFVKAALSEGVSVHQLSGLRHYLKDHDAGAFAFGAPTDHVYQVTGRLPEDFETIARRYAAAPAVQRSFANRARAIAAFLRTPFSRGYDLERFERAQFHPAPPAPALAMQSADWRAGHAAIAGPAAMKLQLAAE